MNDRRGLAIAVVVPLTQWIGVRPFGFHLLRELIIAAVPFGGTAAPPLLPLAVGVPFPISLNRREQ